MFNYSLSVDYLESTLGIIPIPDPHPKTSINFYQHILFPGEFVATMQHPQISKLRFKYQELIWFTPNDSFKASGTQKKGKTPVTSPEDEHFETPVRPNRPRI
jgi:hypothetical protein